MTRPTTKRQKINHVIFKKVNRIGSGFEYIYECPYTISCCDIAHFWIIEQVIEPIFSQGQKPPDFLASSLSRHASDTAMYYLLKYNTHMYPSHHRQRRQGHRFEI